MSQTTITMKRAKMYILQCVIMMMSAGWFGCADENNAVIIDKPDLPTSSIVVVYDNDVHCAVDGYAKLAALRQEMREKIPFVTTVSCGDFIQGDVVGSISRGEGIVEILNEVDYDMVTLGNHEFDYGMTQMFGLMERLDATVVNANFRDLQTNELPFLPYRIVRYGNVDIAYIGFTTTTTAISVSPNTFRDGEGNVIYGFSKDIFYENAQRYIDEAKAEGADYVVALSHLGDRGYNDHPSSLNLIANTVGLDVVLDGHDHHVISDTLVTDREGNSVLLSSTGTKFEYIGVLTLSTEGIFTTRLVPAGEENLHVDASVQGFVEDVKLKVLSEGERVIGNSEVNLSIYDENSKRIIRNKEANIGDFCCDAFRIMLDTDVAMLNGGGIRADIPIGEVTYNNCYSVFPFNNTACTATITGQQLLDALEFSVSFLPNENGSFMQVSGMKFEVDPTVPTPIVLDEEELFSYVADGERRVGNLRILNKENGKYEPIDVDKVYTISSFSYQLKELGSAGMLRYAILKEDNLGQDVDILVNYIGDYLGGVIGNEYAGTDGRIVIK